MFVRDCVHANRAAHGVACTANSWHLQGGFWPVLARAWTRAGKGAWWWGPQAGVKRASAFAPSALDLRVFKNMISLFENR